MSKEKIDNQFKDSLGNLHSKPSERVWAGIESALNNMPVKQQKKSRAVWYYSAAAVFIGILFFFYLRSCNNQDNSSQQVYASSGKSSQKTQENSALEQNSAIANNTELSSSSDQSSNINSTQTLTSNNQTPTPQKTKFKPVNKIQTRHIANVATSNSNLSAKPSDVINSTAGLSLPVNQSIQNPSTATDVYSQSIAEIPNETNQTELIPQLGKNSDNIVFQAEEKQAESTSSAPNATLGVKRATNLSFDIYGGGVYTFSNKSVVMDYESPSIAGKPRTNIITPQLGMNAKYTVNNWYITAGLGYSVLGENINYTINRTGVDTSGSYANPVLSGLLYDTNGYYDDPLYPGVAFPILVNPHFDTLGFNWITVKENYTYSDKVKSANRYKYIDIPVTFGHLWNYNHLQFDVSAGASFAIRLGVQGNSINNNEVSSFSEKNNPYKKVITTALLGVGVAYQYDSRTKLFFRPTYRINLGSVFESSDNSGVKYNSFALNAGLNYSLN